MITRRDYYVDDYNGYDSWWWSPTGYIVKWTIVAAIFLLFVAWCVGGYIHARRRMRRGLPPLAYHRWLVPRTQRARFAPHPQNQFSFYQHRTDALYNAYNGNYNMHGYPEPPPVYNNDVPPTYQPPPGATKIDPHQGFGASAAGERATQEAQPVEVEAPGRAAGNPFR